MIQSHKNLLLISLFYLLAACDNPATQSNQHIEEGKRLYKAGDYLHAHKAFEKAVAVDPKNSQSRLQIADALNNLGDLQSAIKQYQIIVDQDAKQVNARIKLGQIYLLAGKIPEAEKLAQEALVLDAANNEAITLMGGILSAQNQTDAAFTMAEQALKAKPDDIPATLLLAALNAKIGKSDKAINLLQQSINKNPSNIAPRLLLANLYLHVKEPEETRLLLTSIISLEPKQLVHRQRLAMFHIDIQQLDEAEAVLRTASADFPEEEAKLLLVNFLETKRSPEVAIAELIPMIEQKPDDYELRFKLADLQLAQNHLADVEEILTETIKLTKQVPQTIRARNKLAQFYLTNQRIEEAKTLVKTTLSEQPDNSDAHILKAELAFSDGNISEAISDLSAILTDEASNIKALKVLSKAHQLNNAPQLALENLKKILDLAPADEDARLDLADLLVKTGDTTQAEQQLNTLFRLNPSSKNGLATLVKIYLAQKQWDQARQTAKNLQAYFTNDAAGYYLEGLSYQAEGKFDKSLAPLSLALQKQPQAIEPLSQLIASYLALRQPEKAIEKLNEIIKKQPDHFFAYNLLGGVYSKNDNLDKAVDAYQKVIELNPSWPKSYRNLAVIKQLQKKPEEAIDTLSKGISNCADSAILVTELAQLYHDQGNHDQVIALYEKIHQNKPESLAVINDLVSYVTAYAKDNRQLESAALLLEPLRQSNNPYLLDTAAWFLYHQGHFDLAKQTLLKSQKLNPEFAASQYHLGMAFLKLGDKAQAKQHLQKAVDGKTEFIGLKETKELLKNM